jgi:hypothetical protein
MVTMLEVYITEEQCSVVLFLWARGLNAKDTHKEMVPVYGRKCLPCEAVHNWVEKFSQERSDVTDDTQPGMEVAKITAKKLLCCGFQRAGKAMGQVYQFWWRIYQEINVLSMLEYHTFYVLYLSVTCLLTLPCI